MQTSTSDYAQGGNKGMMINKEHTKRMTAVERDS